MAQLLQGPAGSVAEVTFVPAAQRGDEAGRAAAKTVQLARAPISLKPVSSAACRVGTRSAYLATAADADTEVGSEALSDPGNGSVLVRGPPSPPGAGVE